MRSLGAAAVVAALCIGAAVLRYGLTPIGGYDIFWHVATGDEILRTRSLLPSDPFSYVAAGAPWPYKDAGAAILLSVLHRLGGFSAIVVAKTLVFLATVLTVGVGLIRYRRVPWPLAALLLSVLVEASAFRVTERPQALAFLGTAVVLLVMERHRAGQGRLWWVVPTTLVIANLHRGALVIPVLVAVYAVGAMIDRRGATVPRRERLELWLSALGSGLACLATPFGTAIVETSGLLLTDAASRTLIPEWHPTTLASAMAASPATLGFAAVGVLSFVARGRNQSARDIGLTLLGLALALRTVRFLPYLPLLASAPVASGLLSVHLPWNRAPGRAIGVASALIAVLMATSSGLPEPRLGLQKGRYPTKAIAWAQRVGIRGKPMNDFRFGGYLMWCCHGRYPVYVDGRNELVYSPEQVARAARLLDDPQALEAERQRYGFEWILAPTQPEAVGRAHVDRDPRWVLVHQSQAAVVYVYRDGQNGEIARRDGYRRLRAFDLRRSILEGVRSADVRVRRETVAEVRRMMADDPTSYYAEVAMAVAALGREGGGRASGSGDGSAPGVRE